MIYDITLVAENAPSFSKALRDVIEDYQDAQLRVEVQYQPVSVATTGRTLHNALVIAYKVAPERRF